MFYLATLLCLLRLEEKTNFLSLQAALSSIPSDECFVMLVDFNAHVGSRGVDDEWLFERSLDGYGELNVAGKELLTLSTNEATICCGLKKMTSISKLGNTQSPSIDCDYEVS